MNFTIKIITETLTDRSKVYNVALIGDGQTLRLMARSQQDALQIAYKLADLIDDHTVDTVTLAAA